MRDLRAAISDHLFFDDVAEELEDATHLRVFSKIARRKLMLMQQFSLSLTTSFNLSANSEISLKCKVDMY